MALQYGYVKCKVVSEAQLKPSPQPQEIQYHLHVTLHVATAHGDMELWDTAINVGTNDADDLLMYRLAFDFHHALRDRLAAADPGFHDLTDHSELPALDFLRSNVLAETGHWRESDVMDGTEHPEPVASLKRLLLRAKTENANVYIFGRTYPTGDRGIHDVHMNQGSGSARFFHTVGNDRNDHNDIWQDGAVLVDLSDAGWAGYFTVFTQQQVPTDDLGNPQGNSHPVLDSDAGSLVDSHGFHTR
jgi:uncharacterized protein YukJ